MIKLICDICGTSYPETEEKCPTCGYSRAFQELSEDQEERPVVREKVRGGRFSRKNVQKRLKEQSRKQEEAAAQPRPPVHEEETALPAELIVEAPAPAEDPAVEVLVLPVEIPDA